MAMGPSFLAVETTKTLLLLRELVPDRDLEAVSLQSPIARPHSDLYPRP